MRSETEWFGFVFFEDINLSFYFCGPQLQASHLKISLDSTYLIPGCGNAPSVAQPPHLIALNINVENFSAFCSEIADGSDSLES